MVFFGRNKSDRRELLASMDQISLHKIHDNGRCSSRDMGPKGSGALPPPRIITKSVVNKLERKPSQNVSRNKCLYNYLEEEL